MSVLTIEQRVAAGSNFTGSNGGSTGTITTVAGNLIGQGETFQLRARAKDVFTFVFDKTGTLADEPKVRVVRITGAMTAAQVRDAIITAINRTPGLAMYASNGGAAQVNLLNALNGTAGNLAALPDTVADAGFVVSAMAGGVNWPSGPVEVEGVRQFPAATFGGIFDFDFVEKRSIAQTPIIRPSLWRVDRMLIQSTGAASYTVNVLLPDGTQAQVQTGAGGVVLITTPILLTGDERVQLVTAGGAAEMYARVTARPAA